MRERPILFSAPMVRALLAGTKTQTRRVAPIESFGVKQIEPGSITWAIRFTKPIGKDGVVGHYSGGLFTAEQASRIVASQFCPYGQTGDRLWVRETWSTHRCFDHISPAALTTRSLHYWADGEIKSGKGRPSIHMPRWASRITLEITGVRVERLQAISNEDAEAEGVKCDLSSLGFRDHFQTLWASINGAESWNANPWVWVVEFKRVQP